MLSGSLPPARASAATNDMQSVRRSVLRPGRSDMVVSTNRPPFPPSLEAISLQTDRPLRWVRRDWSAVIGGPRGTTPAISPSSAQSVSRCHIKISAPWKIHPRRDNHGSDMPPPYENIAGHIKISPYYIIAPSIKVFTRPTIYLAVAGRGGFCQ